MQALEINYCDEKFKEIFKLYLSSFPKYERFSRFKIKQLIKKTDSNLIAFFENDLLLGFALIVCYCETVFLLYLAVNSSLRHLGYGSKILSGLKNKYANKTFFLNIESTLDESINKQERDIRLKFYSQNGFKKTEYRLIDKRVNYDVIYFGKNFELKIYIQALKKLYGQFYQPKIEKII